MKSHLKAWAMLSLVGAGLCTAFLASPAKAWADPPRGWGYDGHSYRNAALSNRGGFGGFFTNRNTPPYHYGWDRARQIAWHREGHAFGHYRPFSPAPPHRFW